jgi:MFS family permease
MDAISRAMARARQDDLIRHMQLQQGARDARGPGGPFGLPREVWLLAVGILINYLGYGAVLPFEVIYLHDHRGFGLALAGFIVSLITGMAVVTAALTGPLIDRFGARMVAAAAAIGLAAGYAGLAFARSPAAAIVAAATAGMGNGALNPSQSTLVNTVVPARLRHRATAVSRVGANIGIGLGGAVGGFVARYDMARLFLANAFSYVAFAAVLLAVVRGGERPASLPGGYRLVLQDRAFVRLLLVNTAVIAVGWGVFTWLLPPYARDALGLGPPLIGLLLLANAVTVAVVQIPVARVAEGRRRARTMALAALVFALAVLLVVVAGGWHTFTWLLGAAILVGVGECLYTTVLMPLTADLAPPSLRGRYMAAIGLSWWLGLAVAPALGAPLLSPPVFLVAALVAAVAAVAALQLDRVLPAGARLTPAAKESDRADRPPGLRQ